MPRLTKIYTGLGDKGKTYGPGGKIVDKDNPTVRLFGTVDELNSWLGLIRSKLGKNSRLSMLLKSIQNDLFVLNADILGAKKKITKERCDKIKEKIEKYNSLLPSLDDFILPSGNEIATLLHIARSVCRRAERVAVTLAKKRKINNLVLVYLNRLSDLLFILARYVNKLYGEKEELVKW